MPAQLLWVIQSSRATCCITFYPDKFEDIIVLKNNWFTLFRMLLSGTVNGWEEGEGGGGWGGGYTYLTKMKTDLRKIQKIYKPRETPHCVLLKLSEISNFS